MFGLSSQTWGDKGKTQSYLTVKPLSIWALLSAPWQCRNCRYLWGLPFLFLFVSYFISCSSEAMRMEICFRIPRALSFSLCLYMYIYLHEIQWVIINKRSHWIVYSGFKLHESKSKKVVSPYTHYFPIPAGRWDVSSILQFWIQHNFLALHRVFPLCASVQRPLWLSQNLTPSTVTEQWLIPHTPLPNGIHIWHCRKTFF